MNQRGLENPITRKRGERKKHFKRRKGIQNPKEEERTI